MDQGFQHSNDSFRYAVCVRSITRERGIKDGADETSGTGGMEIDIYVGGIVVE